MKWAPDDWPYYAYRVEHDYVNSARAVYARNGSLIGSLSDLDVIRHTDHWIETWIRSIYDDWREREQS